MLQFMLNDRFWTKVDKSHPSGCWLWLAGRNNKGYGQFRPGGIAPKVLAHRLSYEDAHGAIPKGRIILHSCDNPRCVNPDHLRMGSMKDNTADMDAKGRRVSNPARGEANPSTDKTASEIISIRQDYAAGVPLKEIRSKYGITKSALQGYASGRSWSHILGANGCPGLDALKASSRRRRRNSAILNKDTADIIRERLSKGELGIDLAKEYQVHKATISDIKLRKVWP